MLCAAPGVSSNTVDIFNATSGRWTTAVLSAARKELSATSLPSQGLAFFAGDYTSTCFFELSMLRDGGMRGSRGACVGWKEARFEPLEMNADALRSIRCFQQYCGHFRCN
jgi:hypothetical protein